MSASVASDDKLPVIRQQAAGWVYGLSGIASGCVSSVATYPLDTVKSRLQVEGPVSGVKGGSFAQSGAIARNIVAAHGVRGLYRGICTNLLALGPSTGLFFYCYEGLKPFVGDSVFLAGSGAWITMAGATNPLWMVKLRQQTQPDVYGKLSLMRCLRKIAKTEGIWKGWFGKGMLSSFMGAPSVSLQLLLYENWKGTVSVPVASALSIAVSSSLTYPHEIVRSRMQSGHAGGIFETFKDVYRKEGGLKGLYSGFGVNITRLVVGSAVTFTIYEASIELIQQFASPPARYDAVQDKSTT